MIKVSMRDYMRHTEEYDGICLACGEWTCGGVEPDADGYTCEFCEETEVMGAEDAMINNLISVEE